jgi:hypothetical protein
MRSVCFLLSSLLIPTVTSSQETPRADIDHVIIAINNLDQGIRDFAELTGVTPIKGGEHPGRSTQNALVSLGSGRYLEILAPASGVSNPESVIPFPKLTVGGWALHGNLDAQLASLKAAGFATVGPTPGSRQKPDGTMLEWRTGGAQGAGLSLAPFLIEWSARTPHPSTTSPTGCRLENVIVREADPANLQKFFTAIGYRGEASKGDRGMVINLTCPKGKVSFATIE